MMQMVGLVASMDADTFRDVINASSRKIREILFARLGIKQQSKRLLMKAQDKRDERAKLVHDRLSAGKTKQEEEVCRELIRNWLMTKRPMLKSALDFLQVPNDNGLVEEETDFFSQLSKEKAEELYFYLIKDFPKQHVKTYLLFMGVDLPV